MKKILIAGAVAALLAGCSLAPVNERPPAPVPAAWPAGEAYRPADQANDGRAAADIAWRDFIVDERLRKLIELALDNNRDLRVSILNIDKARAQYGVARADQLPHVDATAGQSASYIPAGLSTTGAAYTSRQYSAGLGVSAFELDLSGRLKNLSAAARERYLGTEEDRRTQQISLVAEVANAWLTLAADQERLRLAQETLANQKTSEDLTRRRFEAGATSGLDVQQARTSVESARNDVAVYTAQVAADRNALVLLVGTEVAPELLPAGQIDPVTTLTELPVGIPSTVLQRRPDVLSAERTLRAANADIGAARAAFFPSISLTASAGSATSALSGLFKAGTGAWSFVPALTLPIFAGGANRANLQVAQVDKDIAVAQYEKAVQTGFREVADALAQRGTLGERVAAENALVDASAKSYAIYQARYQKGTDTYLNALVSQRSLYAAEQGLIDARLALASNQVTMYKVLGGGWQ